MMCDQMTLLKKSFDEMQDLHIHVYVQLSNSVLCLLFVLSTGQQDDQRVTSSRP